MSTPDAATKIYRGRFAPSPTGPLHIGSLIAATGSYLQARRQNGLWFVRIEDIDPPREAKGASENIIRTLDEFGFEWDGEILFQSSRIGIYEEVIQMLIKNERAYFCNCSRKLINETATIGVNGPIYPLTCFHKTRHTKGALRFHTRDTVIHFNDMVQGKISQNSAKESGDFVIKRSDGLFNYQLAVVIDDDCQGISEIVRGSDLLYLTPGQIDLQDALHYPTPTYLHMPVVTNEHGQKLSKQTRAKAIDSKQGASLLWFCLDFLGQRPPPELKTESLTTFWQWAIVHWDPRRIPRCLSLPIKTDTAYPLI